MVAEEPRAPGQLPHSHQMGLPARPAVHPAGRDRAPGPPRPPSAPRDPRVHPPRPPPQPVHPDPGRGPQGDWTLGGPLSHPPAPTHRSAGLCRVPATPGLAAEVGRGGGRVIDVGQPVLGPARLLRPIRGTAEPRRRPEQRICKCGEAGGIRGREGLRAVSLRGVAPHLSPAGLEQGPRIAKPHLHS